MTDLVPTTVPIVGHPDHVAMTLRAAYGRGTLLTHPDAIGVRHLADGRCVVKVRMLLPARKPALRVRYRRWEKAHEVSAALLKAAAFVTVLLTLGVTLLAVAVSLVTGWLAQYGAALSGIGIAALLLFLLLLNRGNHSGACPGIAVHCKGCKR